MTAVHPDTWSELRTAQAEAEAADRAWRSARFAWFVAPAGKRRERKAAADAALRAALEAARTLQACKREAGVR